MVKKMNMEEVKDTLYDIAEMFFVGATVIWTEQIITKPQLPYVTLKVGPIQRTSFPVIDDDGNRYYPCRTIAEVNLYTKGKPVTVKEKATGNFANTATSDMMDFFSFMESDRITDLLAGKGMDISLVPPVRDLTDLQNDSRYRYRSMAEATVSFAQEADGPYGIGGMPSAPNSSGGGTSEIVAATQETIEEVEITEGGNDYDEEQSIG